ncbi:carboxymuconolactone decarboxylase family protein [Spirillospora sp. NPDC047279]|uniref:carboxymuconolactone decarboxylase family protein n=1 Tax=Spirillospora sp. NPDC047279 TaxID=3155478 RepID=UPI003402CC15
MPTAALRLPPLPGDEWDERERAALAVLLPARRRDPEGAGNALATLVRHPDLAEAFLTFSAHLLVRSTLPPRLRELAILRVARRRECEYEWSHHVMMAAKAGLTEAEIEAAGRGEAAGGLDAAVLRAVDELDEASTVSDATWAELGAHLDDRQRMDLVFTVGGYTLMAMAFNTFGVQPEHGAAPGN